MKKIPSNNFFEEIDKSKTSAHTRGTNLRKQLANSINIRIRDSPDKEEDKIGSRTERKYEQKLIRNEHKNKIIDWGHSDIYKAVLNGHEEFNIENNPRVYFETEIPYILTMLKQRQKEVLIGSLYKPFFAKAKATLKKLANELMDQKIIEEIDKQYPTVIIVY